MRKEHATRLTLLSAFGLVAALMGVPLAALAQEVKPAGPAPQARPPAPPANAQAPAPQGGQEEMAEAKEFVYEPLQVGDATQGLLAWQRSGEVASATSRPIAGNVAHRSYERYLKSFEFPIPEKMSSSVKTSSGSGGGAPR